jgi:hypothetical protein
VLNARDKGGDESGMVLELPGYDVGDADGRSARGDRGEGVGGKCWMGWLFLLSCLDGSDFSIIADISGNEGRRTTQPSPNYPLNQPSRQPSTIQKSTRPMNPRIPHQARRCNKHKRLNQVWKVGCEGRGDTST